MNRVFRTGMFCAIAYLLISASSAGAQHPTKSTPKTDEASRALVGTWQGTLSTDHGSFGMRVGVARDSVWHVSVAFDADQPVDAGEVTDVTVDGSKLSWAQSLRGMSCKSSAVRIGDTLKGETSCGHGTLGFVLDRKK
jgi:hypothetical protein